jgi:hypothetical protein
VINKALAHDVYSPADLQRAFEAAVGEIHQTGQAMQRLRYRTPIVQRNLEPPSRVETEKRAVSDAAKALARLWKVSPHPAR